MNKNNVNQFSLAKIELEEGKFGDLFKECIEVLKNNVVILNTSETLKVQEFFKDLISEFLFTGGSRIDWSKVDRKKDIILKNQTISSNDL